MKVDIDRIPEKEGSVKLDFEPNAKDPEIQFYKDGKLVGTALRNGHHMTWNPKTQKPELPFTLYYFSFKPL